MNARTQYQIGAAELDVVLAMVRSGTLAAAGERLGVDASTVFRALQRIERGLGLALFERSRSGYLANELAQALAEQAEQVEAALEAARSAAQQRPDRVAGTVRITTTDTILHGLVAPALKPLRAAHPLLDYELHAGNELASLTRRDADIAVRATRRPPQHLVGRHVGPIRVALYAAKKSAIKRVDDLDPATPWIAPDDALPDHPSVVWRKRRFPKVQPAYRVSSIMTVMELVALGLGVGVLPLFLAAQRSDLRQLGEVLDECQTELWLLTHPESRHLRRVATVYGHLAETLSLD
ncbi:LysR family transcriptional regulator [Rhizobacter sp. AJA081-3]|uniref:LysR family transcriptional regulator n=1 Tax=Rhizobacter sp. AJA081-3 TaxID=2753607 RepID=UPI001ADFABC9|nr:LysR family transcriptional regulator [Rhizobacter sp. AJA081-3]QTN22098.1 LysR family transcriptional regulator [Rhizobacter sp. AJA081-3]